MLYSTNGETATTYVISVNNHDRRLSLTIVENNIHQNPLIANDLKDKLKVQLQGSIRRIPPRESDQKTEKTFRKMPTGSGRCNSGSRIESFRVTNATGPTMKYGLDFVTVSFWIDLHAKTASNDTMRE